MSDTTTDEIKMLEQRLAFLEDREAIRDIIYAYCRGADRCDEELLQSCYHPDAVDYHWFWNGNAHEFTKYIIPVLKQLHSSQHAITNIMIDLPVGSNKAFVESQWNVLHRIPMDAQSVIDQKLEGRYLDILEKRNGVWKILQRRVVAETYREHVNKIEKVMQLPPGHPGLAQRAPNDPVYKGFSLQEEHFKAANEIDLWEIARNQNRLSS
jgi:hypothetical protein